MLKDGRGLDIIVDERAGEVTAEPPIIDSNPAVQTDEWQGIVNRYDGSTARVDMNGNPINTKEPTGEISERAKRLLTDYFHRQTNPLGCIIDSDGDWRPY